MGGARPDLNRVAMSAVWPMREGCCYATMSVGQWDELLSEAYRQGWVLLELDDDKQLVAAYRQPMGVRHG
jgi:hypothetical protein